MSARQNQFWPCCLRLQRLDGNPRTVPTPTRLGSGPARSPSGAATNQMPGAVNSLAATPAKPGDLPNWLDAPDLAATLRPEERDRYTYPIVRVFRPAARISRCRGRRSTRSMSRQRRSVWRSIPKRRQPNEHGNPARGRDQDQLNTGQREQPVRASVRDRATARPRDGFSSACRGRKSPTLKPNPRRLGCDHVGMLRASTSTL